VVLAIRFRTGVLRRGTLRPLDRSLRHLFAGIAGLVGGLPTPLESVPPGVALRPTLVAARTPRRVAIALPRAVLRTPVCVRGSFARVLLVSTGLRRLIAGSLHLLVARSRRLFPSVALPVPRVATVVARRPTRIPPRTPLEIAVALPRAILRTPVRVGRLAVAILAVRSGIGRLLRGGLGGFVAI